jgi:hypothetical protein
MVILRTMFRFSGAWSLRTRQASSPNVTPRHQCRRFSISQWLRIAYVNRFESGGSELTK